MIGEFIKSSNYRRLFVSLVFLIISVSLIMASSALSAETQHYNPRTIINVKWGDAPEEFGLRAGADTSGAKTFSLDKKGNIYILDSIKGHIKKYDSYGNYIGNIGNNEIHGNSFAVGSSGEIYFLMNSAGSFIIREYSKSGEYVNDLPISTDIKLIEGYNQKITLDDQDNLYVNRHQTQYQIGKKQDGKMSKIKIKNVLNEEGGFKYGFGKNKGKIPESKLMHERKGLKSMLKLNRLIKVRIENKHEANIYVTTEAGKRVKKIDMSTEDKFGSITFIEQDAAGYVYVEIGRITEDQKVHLDIRKYDEDGNLIAIFEAPSDYYTTMYKRIEIDKEGNVYQLYTTADGVQIIKWERS